MNKKNNCYNRRLPFREILLHRNLIYQFARRQIEGRYKGSFFGLVWTVINPLVMLLIYTFIFGVVFKARWGNSSVEGSLVEFAIILLCGISTFNIFSECVSSAPSLIVNNANLVKKVVFPLEILPVSTLLAAVFHGVINLAVVLVVQVIVVGTIPLTCLFWPIFIFPLLCFSLGMTWFLSGLGVFFRDIQQLIGLMLTALFFVTPIFFSAGAVPPAFAVLVNINPLSYIIESIRMVVLWNQIPRFDTFAMILAVALLVLCGGYIFFMRTRKAFADIL